MSAADRPVAVVTGATGGIGREIALGLAQAGLHVVLVARDRVRGEAARAWIAEQAPGASTEIEVVDLSLLIETRRAAAAIVTRHSRLAVLVNNAGVFEAKRTLTAEGRERVLAVNLLSPFVLTETLLPALTEGAPSRIVNVGSSSSDRARIEPERLELGRRWTMVRAYAGSKLALMMVTFELARRLEGSGVTANVVHPGLVATGLVRPGGVIGLAWRLMAGVALSNREGADTPLHVALSTDVAGLSGAYFKRRRVVPPNPRALDRAMAARVWAETARLAALAPDAPRPARPASPSA